MAKKRQKQTNKQPNNYNDSYVYLPNNFNGEGYSSQNFINPSWGGQFQMGGNLPGTVGFMYSRDGAPSNGKYAKKTKSSAQKGANLYPIEPWSKQGLNSADSLQRGTMYKMSYIDQNKLYNIPIPKGVNPTDIGYLTTSPGQIDPNILAQKRLKGNVPSYDISGSVAGLNHPQGANVSNFQDGGSLNPVSKLALIKERNNKRDSVQLSLLGKYPNPKDYNKVNLGMLNYFQNEPEKYKYLSKKKKGGIVKDDMGYWNPSNHGKIVEINSPEITMQGISEPLLGVSNLGHTQMMYPGNDYSFSGSKVREYPIGEITKGSKQDKGQKKKLTQLTDFSNNNNMEQAKDGKWIQKAINPKHKGFCTPMSKKTCTPKRKALAKTFKKHHGFHEDGGSISMQVGGDVMPLNEYTQVDTNPNLPNYNISSSNVSKQPSQFSNFLKGNGYNIGQGIGAIGQGLQSGNMENGPSAAQRAVGQFGPWGAAISQVSQIGTGLTNKSNNAVVGTLGTAIFDPGSVWTNKDLSTKDRILGGLDPIYGGYKAYQARQAKKKQAEQVNGLVQKASKSIDVDINKPKRYVRPEDVPIQNDQMSPQQGVGTNYLAKFGAKLPGEIQNTYNSPTTLYSDLGYEPLNDSNKLKQFEKGGYMNPEYNPQVISKFGEHTMKELLKPDPMMNTLRTGGNLRVNSHYALGGELQVHGGGHMESLSQNPYLPDGGETVMFKGKSHADGGMPITYGKNPVEVEGGEPAVKLQDGGTGEDNLVVFGNLKWDKKYGGDGRKFKNIVADLSKKEDRQNKIQNKGLKLVDETSTDNAFDLLKMNSGKALMMGSDMKLKEIAEKKQEASIVQNAINETAEEHGLNADHLAKGKIKKAKRGAKIPSYQSGGVAASIFGDYAPKVSRVIPASDSTNFLNIGYNWVPDNKNVLGKETTINPVVPTGSPDFNKSFGDARKRGLKEFNWNGKKYTTDLAKPSKKTDYVGIQSSGEVNPPQYTPYSAEGEVGLAPRHGGKTNDHSTTDNPTTGKSKGFDWMTAVGQLYPYFRPSNQIPLDQNQLTGEYYALSHNTLDPVSAQKYNPVLDQVYDISLQDQLNANQADFNSIQRLVGNNPAAQSVLAAQKYAANSGILGEQFRLNQAQKAGIYSKNRDILNDAQLKNLAILDQQYQRQAQAKSNTKAIAQQAYTSISDKIAQNKLENRTLGVYENLYNYRYDNLGRAINLNTPQQFNIPEITPLKKDKKTGKNGAIVKAMRNL